MKVGVIGAGGWMGQEVCRAIEAAPDLLLAARVGRDDPLDELVSTEAEVAVEFTTPSSVTANVRWCLEHGIHVVVGTTGLDDAALKQFSTWSDEHGANVFVAPNFAVGAVLMMRFAALAAPHFERAEIVERHGPQKLDAPSGTALRTASLMNDARGAPWSRQGEGSQPSRGLSEGGVPIHSVRTPGSVAHQEVIFGGQGQTLSIKHDSTDRSSFMPGVLLAISAVPQRRGLTVGLEHLLDL